jgi:hypothetical protein
MLTSRAALWLLTAICQAQDPPPIDVGAHFETTVVESRFGTTTVDPSRLRGEIYFLEPDTQSLPKFEKLKPVGVIYANGLYLPTRDFAEGFPGVTDRFEWFALDYTGHFYIRKPGKYHFTLLSDDGSKLYIDGRTIIKNDGLHGTVRVDGSVNLKGGLHTIRISYFQGPRYGICLILAVAGPGDKDWRIFNTDEFKPPANPADWKFGSPADLNKLPDPKTGKVRKPS